MSFHLTVDRDYIKQKLMNHLKTLDPVCIDQIAEIIDTMGSTNASVIFKSLDGYVFPDLIWSVNDQVMVHYDRLYTHRYDTEAMKTAGIIDDQGLIQCRIISVSKFSNEVRLQYKYINNGETGTSEWSIDVKEIERTVGLERPNLNDLL